MQAIQGVPQTPTSVIIFAIIMGLLWLSTVAPTNALVAIMFGTRHLGLLGGLVFFSHQIGSFIGVFYGGYLRETTGSYDVVWWLGVALGGKAETLAGLCGLGDLVLTCSSPQSRNMSFGLALGQGRSAGAILAERNAVTEGVATAPALVDLAHKHGVEMPISEGVAAILSDQTTVSDAMSALLARPYKGE